jgi:hypothetical protein
MRRLGPREWWPKATQGGPSGLSPLRSDGSHDGQAEMLDRVSGGQRHQAWVHPDQMVLVVVRREAGPIAQWPKALKLELENDSRWPGDLLKNRHCESLKDRLSLLFLSACWRGEMLQMKTMRREPQWSHKLVWQPSENWRTFHLNSVFIVIFDHQNYFHRAVGGRGAAPHFPSDISGRGGVVLTSHIYVGGPGIRQVIAGT